MKILRLISRLITGIVFIFSGFVKAVDPLGSTYKFTDYFNAFHLGFLEPLALPLAIVLSSTELVLGITLLLGYRMRAAAWVLLFFMSFFTLLTFILALTNPVTDCGCFGDALILTNWETFFKNVVLMGFVLILFTGRSKFTELRFPAVEWGVVALFFAITVVFSLYNYNHLPVLDFRPYAIGTNIEQGMIIPEGAPEDVYSTELMYKNKKSGEEKVFSMKDFPKDTLTWDFVDARSELVKRGYEPPIHNFNIVAPNGVDITDHILTRSGFTFLLIS
ncbi:MAG TPA: BT_3928 family protein, partial [Bacteroidales bacterium]|nr:BT_3928 family protein [Bacteroidales bacterium]